jgi:hypothetical protein
MSKDESWRDLCLVKKELKYLVLPVRNVKNTFIFESIIFQIFTVFYLWPFCNPIYLSLKYNESIAWSVSH